MSVESPAQPQQFPLTQAFRWLMLTPDDLLSQCQRTPYQASGPGGQKRNRVYSGIRFEHKPSGLRAESAAHREAARNQKDALQKLRLELALAAARSVPLFADRTAPETDDAAAGDASGGPHPSAPIAIPANFPAFRAKINPEHRDFPCVVLRALIALRENQGEPKGAAQVLGVSTSACVKFLAIHKQVFAEANRVRERLGRPTLRV